VKTCELSVSIICKTGWGKSESSRQSPWSVLSSLYVLKLSFSKTSLIPLSTSHTSIFLHSISKFISFHSPFHILLSSYTPAQNFYPSTLHFKISILPISISLLSPLPPPLKLLSSYTPAQNFYPFTLHFTYFYPLTLQLKISILPVSISKFLSFQSPSHFYPPYLHPSNFYPRTLHLKMFILPRSISKFLSSHSPSQNFYPSTLPLT
jgi:hypothetical protein